MDKNLEGTIREISGFLNKTITEQQIAELKDHLDINNFRKNQAVNGDILFELGAGIKGEQPFVRKGKTKGGWNDEFTPELKQRAFKWIRENYQKFSVRFPVDFND